MTPAKPHHGGMDESRWAHEGDCFAPAHGRLCVRAAIDYASGAAKPGEHAARQYALQQRALALGWPMERVHVIDSDLGQSGASGQTGKGFNGW